MGGVGWGVAWTKAKLQKLLVACKASQRALEDSFQPAIVVSRLRPHELRHHPKRKNGHRGTEPAVIPPGAHPGDGSPPPSPTRAATQVRARHPRRHRMPLPVRAAACAGTRGIV